MGAHTCCGTIMKVVVVGAGIAGLAVAWRLAQAGIAVELVERGLAGRGATWASAGMLAPVAEFGNDDGPLARFAHAARAAWPAFAAELEEASGRTIGFRAEGSLTVARTPARAEALKTLAACLCAKGTDAVWLSGNDLSAREELLSPDLIGAMHVPVDAQADNRALAAALIAAFSNLPVILRQHCDVGSLVVEHGRVRGVATAQGVAAADAVVHATGAWMNLIGGSEMGAVPPVAPIKGQMAALAIPHGVKAPRALIWDEDVYLVPRQDRLFLGATVEDVGFDTSVSRAACERLLAAARLVIPSLGAWSFSELWAGLRPRTPDEQPVLGATSIAGLYVAGGQFRNGILFAPLVAEIVCRSILGEVVDSAAAIFDPRRFEGTQP
jgi:glycine oxidase